MIGRSRPTRPFEVDRSKIRELALALGDNNPIYHSVEAARQAGYNDLAIPPTFPTLFGYWSQVSEDTRQVDLGIPLAQALHGEEEYTYLAPIQVGDVISGVRTLADVQEKQGKAGTMLLATFETLYHNQHNAEVLKTKTLVIVRL